MLAHEGVSERGIHGPLARSLRTGRCRMSGLGAGCPAAHEEPDVRASGRMSGLELPDSSALWIACAGFPGRRRMSGPSRGAGCPGVGRMSGRCRVAWRPSLSGLLLVGGAGCPGSCRMSGRCSSAATPLEALLDPLPCGLVLCFEHLHGCLLGS